MGFLESLIRRKLSQNEIGFSLTISFRISNVIKRKKSGVVTTDYLPNWDWRSLDNYNTIYKPCYIFAALHYNNHYNPHFIIQLDYNSGEPLSITVYPTRINLSIITYYYVKYLILRSRFRVPR